MRGATAPLTPNSKGINMSDLFGISLFFACLAGWLTHIYVCITAASYGLLIAGAIFFPIGILHGWGVWFGIF